MAKWVSQFYTCVTPVLDTSHLHSKCILCAFLVHASIALPLSCSVGRYVVACHMSHWNEGSYGKHCVGVLAAVVDNTIEFSLSPCMLLHGFNTSSHQLNKNKFGTVLL